MSHFLSPVFAPGFFESSSVGTAVLIGALVALVSGPLGVFTVVRGQSFAGEALGDIGTTGGSGAYLVGVGPLWGFLVINLIAVTAMEMIGIQRARGRDLATGIVLGAGLGLAALLLYLDSTYHNTTGAAVTILFGSIFAVGSSTIPLVAAMAAIVLAILLTIARPLLLSSLSPEVAAARGIPVRLVGLAYLLALALSTALCALSIGSILSTALLVGPAAAALRLVRRPGLAMITAALIGLAAVLIGIVLAYDSYTWSSHAHPWPVSFFVVSLVLGMYLLSGLARARARARARGTLFRTTRGSPGHIPGTN